jgi:hypothetical protein
MTTTGACILSVLLLDYSPNWQLDFWYRISYRSSDLMQSRLVC